MERERERRGGGKRKLTCPLFFEDGIDDARE